MQVTKIDPNDANARRRLIWHTRDGKGIPVGRMTTQHLNNAIRYLLDHRQPEDYLPWISVLEAERASRCSRVQTDPRRYYNTDLIPSDEAVYTFTIQPRRRHIRAFDDYFDQSAEDYLWADMADADMVGQEKHADMAEISEEEIKQLLEDFA